MLRLEILSYTHYQGAIRVQTTQIKAFFTELDPVEAQLLSNTEVMTVNFVCLYAWFKKY